MERRHKERQRLELPEKIRINMLFKLIPPLLAAEILKQTTKWNSYTALRDHLITLQHLRSHGPAPMLYNMEEHERWQPLPEQELYSEEANYSSLKDETASK